MTLLGPHPDDTSSEIPCLWASGINPNSRTLHRPCDLLPLITPDPHPSASISGPPHTVSAPDLNFILGPTRVCVMGATFLPITASVHLL